MNQLKESGHYSIAGFVYQILGSGVEAFHICEKVKNEAEPDTLIVLERFGQDAVEKPPEGSDRVPRLIQYKYSTVGKPMNEGQFTDVIFAFVQSASDANRSVNDFRYVISTNRELTDNAQDWREGDGTGRAKAQAYLTTRAEKLVAAQEEKRIEKLKKSKSKSPPKRKAKEVLQKEKQDLAQEMLSVFDLLDYDKKFKSDYENTIVEEAKQYGMLGEEIDRGVDAIVGYLIKLAGSAGPRIVLPETLRLKLTGNEKAVKLCSEDSNKLQRDDLEKFNRPEVPPNVVPRSKVEDLADSIMGYPLTIVYGDGGCGKSVAMSELVSSCLQNFRRPPGFCLLARASSFNPEFAMGRVAAWRRFNSYSSGEKFSDSLRRLDGAFGDRPVLLVCVDAIDEKDKVRLPRDVVEFITELVDYAVQSRYSTETDVAVVSVVVSCRREDEYKNLERMNSLAPSEFINSIKLSDFEPDELIHAAKMSDGVDETVRERIIFRFGSDDQKQLGSSSVPPKTISHIGETIIRHPVIWSKFAILSTAFQHSCLDGLNEGLFQLGEKYFEWFRKKASYRITDLKLGDCKASLTAAAESHSKHTPTDYRKSWRDPIVETVDITKRQAELLFQEAISAGIIVEEEQQGSKWRWNHLWFCNYLLEMEGALK